MLDVNPSLPFDCQSFNQNNQIEAVRRLRDNKRKVKFVQKKWHCCLYVYDSIALQDMVFGVLFWNPSP